MSAATLSQPQTMRTTSTVSAQTFGMEKRRVIHELRHLHLKSEALNLSAVKRMHPELVEAVYAIKPFLGWKQALEAAGIACNDINIKLQERCRCRICGVEAAILTSHLLKTHHLTPLAYRQKHPGVEIMAESVRAARMKASAGMPHWEPLWSWEYVLDRVWSFHAMGWSLSNNDIQRRERALYTYVWKSGRQWDEVLEALGLNPEGIRRSAPRIFLSRDEVLRQLRQQFHMGSYNRKHPLTQDERHLRSAARRMFGSHGEALRAAGISLHEVAVKKARYTHSDIEEFIAQFGQVSRMRVEERLEEVKQFKRRYKWLVYGRFGNWKKACQKFGIPLETLSARGHATKDEVAENN